MQASTRRIARARRGPGFSVAGVGLARTLRELGTMLDANPSANVTMLGDYDARHDREYAATPLAANPVVPYTGIFDGKDHTIRNFRLVDRDSTAGLEDGLFGSIGDNSGNGRVIRLKVFGSIIQTNWERTTRDTAGRFLLGTTMGGVVALNKGVIDGCHSGMRIIGGGAGGQYGGFVGRNLQWTGKIIAGITQAANGEVTTTTAHGYSNGQQLYIIAGATPMVGMNELYGQLVTIAVTSSTKFTIGVNTSGYTPWVSGGETTLGAGIIQNCTSSANASIIVQNYNPYLSPFCASNYGRISNCISTSSATAYCPSGFADSPPTTQYSLGWTGTASASGTTLTVTATGLGTMRTGLYLYVPNEVSGTTLPSGINVIADLGGGQWQLSAPVSPAMSSRDLKAATGAPGTFPTVGAWIGGISGDCGLPDVGRNPFAVITNCQNYATILSSANTNGGNYVGGIVGFMGDGDVLNSVSFGATTGANSVGGIFGQIGVSSGLVQNCISFGAVRSQRDVLGNYGASIGGIGGQVYGIVTSCTSFSDVQGGDAIGGAFGLVRGTAVLTRFNAFGAVTGLVNSDGTSGSGAGGLIGQTISGCVIDQAYCTGVTVAQGRTGGCIGILAAGSTCTNTRWNTDSTGRASGIGQGSSAGVTAITDASLLAAIPSGYDSGWSRSASHCSFYPYINTLPLSLLIGGVLPAPTIVLNPPLSLSFVGFGTSVDSATVDMPPGIQAGDWCWMIQTSINTSTTIPALVTPTGPWGTFTFILQATASTTHGIRLATLFRILDGTETTITGMLAGTRASSKVLAVFRPSNPVTGDVWTRLNPKVAANGAGTGVASQTMGAGTPPCLIVAAALTDGGILPSPIISTGDIDSVTIASGTTPSVQTKASYRINNTASAASTANADTSNGVGVGCVNVSVS